MNCDLPVEGYRLTDLGADDRGYFLACMKGSVIESVSSDEAAMSELWSDCILSAVESNLDGIGIRNEAFILRRSDDIRCGVLWMGESRDQYTCDRTGYVLGIYVEEGLRGIGLGHALLGAAEEWCRDKGFLSMTLNVGFWNKGARDLYEGAGFHERSTVMRKDIQAR